jgi:hypothetical protein
LATFYYSFLGGAISTVVLRRPHIDVGNRCDANFAAEFDAGPGRGTHGRIAPYTGRCGRTPRTMRATSAVAIATAQLSSALGCRTLRRS